MWLGKRVCTTNYKIASKLGNRGPAACQMTSHHHLGSPRGTAYPTAAISLAWACSWAESSDSSPCHHLPGLSATGPDLSSLWAVETPRTPTGSSRLPGRTARSCSSFHVCSSIHRCFHSVCTPPSHSSLEEGPWNRSLLCSGLQTWLSGPGHVPVTAEWIAHGPPQAEPTSGPLSVSVGIGITCRPACLPILALATCSYWLRDLPRPVAIVNWNLPHYDRAPDRCVLGQVGS